MKKIECFKIRVLESNKKDFDFSTAKPVLDIRCEFPSLKPNPVTIVADPFLFVKDDTLFLFYEKKTMRRKADIVMQSTTDLRNWSKPVTVLSEDYHLSYPYVFSDSGKVYMIPESCSAKAIRLYESEDGTLTKFRFVKNLLVDDVDRGIKNKKLFSYSDSSIFKHGDTYFLLTSYRTMDDIDIAELYYSDSLLGPYVKHPCSPISKDNRYARAAGSIIVSGENYYRLSQDCKESYGNNVNVFKIELITKDDYVEKLSIENLLDRNRAFYKMGGHQYNSLIYRGKRIIATDAKEYHFFLMNKIIHKVRDLIVSK